MKRRANNKRWIKKIVTCCSPMLLLLLLGLRFHQVPGSIGRGISFKVPVAKHFILGVTAEPIAADEVASNVAGPEITLTQAVACNTALFSPDDNLQEKLINLIDQEKESISLAIYTFTNKAIAQALLRAHDRGVSIEIVADAGFLSDRYTKIGMLREHGIQVHMYDPQKTPATRAKSVANIMHNKFVVFKRTLDDQAAIWTGSFNFTNSAHLSNQENVVILNDPKIIQRYNTQFQILKERSRPY